MQWWGLGGRHQPAAVRREAEKLPAQVRQHLADRLQRLSLLGFSPLLP